MIKLPRDLPPSPYSHVSGFPRGEVRTFQLHWAYSQMLAERALDWLGAMRHVIAPPSERHGSVPAPSGLPVGLDYWVLDGTAPALESLQQDAWDLIGARCSEALGLELARLDEPEQRVNVNLLLSGRSSGYELHYDPNPITAVLFLTEMPPGQGELVYVDAQGALQGIQPRRGLVAVGDFSQTLHAVSPFWSKPLRLSVPLGYGVPGHTTANGSDYLYGREDSK